MFETKNGLSPAIREKVVELLNARLADCVDLHLQVEARPLERQGPELHRPAQAV